MNATLKQLTQWPPTSTTVIGGGMLFGLASYLLTGSLELAIGLAAGFKLICPQDAPATDQLLKALDLVPNLFRRPPAIAFAMLVAAATLSACGGVKDLADPGKTQADIVEACTASGLFKAVAGAATIAVPAATLPVAVVNAGVDQVCGNPAGFAGDASTAYWVVKNTLAFVKTKAHG
jgi:hypothetical protein